MATGHISLLTIGITAQVHVPAKSAITKDGFIASPGAPCIGFAQTEAAIGERIPVCVVGSSQAIAGANISIGDALEIGANATVVTQSSGAFVGSALNSATAGNYVEVLIEPFGNEKASTGLDFVMVSRTIQPSDFESILHCSSGVTLTLPNDEALAISEAAYARQPHWPGITSSKQRMPWCAPTVAIYAAGAVPPILNTSAVTMSGPPPAMAQYDTIAIQRMGVNQWSYIDTRI